MDGLRGGACGSACGYTRTPRSMSRLFGLAGMVKSAPPPTPSPRTSSMTTVTSLCCPDTRHGMNPPGAQHAGGAAVKRGRSGGLVSSAYGMQPCNKDAGCEAHIQLR